VRLELAADRLDLGELGHVAHPSDVDYVIVSSTIGLATGAPAPIS
jgi:hypothetical protein